MKPRREIVLTMRQVGVLMVAMLLSAFVAVGGSWYLARQPTDELRDPQARVHRLIKGWNDCGKNPECRRAFRRLERSPKP